ncbi:MAG TPA: TonB-dependent receptor, partial [Prevotella sp.]|nr:TonB-dependent receptor [Prevotella sp.]
INGGTFDQITILLNGVNISNPQTGHNASDFPVALADIDHIEVLEGAASRIFGTSAFNGAINIVTRKAQNDGVAALVEGGSFGSFATQGRLQSSFTTGKWTHAYSASGGYKRSDGGTENSDFEKGQAFGQVNLSCDQRFDINAQVGYAQQSYGANTFYSAKFDNQYERTTKFFTALQGETRCGALNFRPSVYWNRSQDRFELIRGSEEAVPYNYHRTDVFGLSLNSWFDSPLGRTAFGAEFRNEDIISGNLGEPLNTPVHIHGTERDYKYGLNRSNLSFHLEHNILLRQFTLSAGFIAFKNTWNEMPFTLYPGVDASVRLGDHWKIYASYNSSLRMPSFTELYYSVGGHKADKYLKPEELRALEGGVKFYSAALLVQASIYHHHSRNLIDWVLDPTAEEPIWQSVNFTKVNTIGTEISARLDLEHLFRLPQSYLSVAYSYNDQDKADEHQLESQSKLEYLRHKLVGTLQLTPIDHWSFLVNYRMQKRTGTYLTVDGVTKPYHTYDLVDARLTWSQPTYSIYAQANNIFSRNYVDYGNVEQPSAWIVVGARLHINL